MEHLEFQIGGGGTNVLATLVAQGLNCAYIGRIGEDTNGHQVYEWLQENKITFLGQVGGETGYSVVLDSQAEDRTILTHKGGNNDLRFKDIPQHLLETKWFYGGSMFGESAKTLEKLFVFMKNHGVQTAFNPNNNVVAKGLAGVKKILSCTDVFILNKEEAQLLGCTGKELLSHGPRIVAITDGAEGAEIYTAEEAFHIIPQRACDVIETTGAGDAFASGFIAGLIREQSARASAQLAIANAESMICSPGGKQGTLSKNDKIRQHQIKSL